MQKNSGLATGFVAYTRTLGLNQSITPNTDVPMNSMTPNTVYLTFERGVLGTYYSSPDMMSSALLKYYSSDFQYGDFVISTFS